MSDNVILAQQTIEGFAEVEEGAGAYFAQREQTLSLTAGETYTVAWDGTEYSCIAVSMDGAMVLGNLSLAGISSLDSGEPFVIGCIPAALTGVADMLMIYTTDAAESHTVAIAVEGLITINRYGDKEYHYGIQTLTLDTTTAKHQRVHTKGTKAEKSVDLDMADGDLIIAPDPGTLLGKVTVQKPETMTPENIRNGVELGGVQGSFIGDTEEITVDLNMADGDQVIVPSAAGKVISKVTVTKPETLAPENIAKDVDIAGLIGTLVAGGGSAKVTYGIVKSSGTAIAIEHGLGCVPDVIAVLLYDSRTGTSSKVFTVYGYSSAFAQKAGISAKSIYYNKTSSPQGEVNGYFDTMTSAQSNFLYGATEEIFYLPKNMDTSSTFIWFAIGGLT